MSTSIQSATLDAHAPAATGQESQHLGHALMRKLSGIITSIREAAEERRVRQHLSTLPDPLLRDIGVAEDEIHRIRACDRFTPRAWVDRIGTSGQRADL